MSRRHNGPHGLTMDQHWAHIQLQLRDHNALSRSSKETPRRGVRQE